MTHSKTFEQIKAFVEALPPCDTNPMDLLLQVYSLQKQKQKSQKLYVFEGAREQPKRLQKDYSYDEYVAGCRKYGIEPQRKLPKRDAFEQMTWTTRRTPIVALDDYGYTSPCTMDAIRGYSLEEFAKLSQDDPSVSLVELHHFCNYLRDCHTKTIDKIANCVLDGNDTTRRVQMTPPAQYHTASHRYRYRELLRRNGVVVQESPNNYQKIEHLFELGELLPNAVGLSNELHFAVHLLEQSIAYSTYLASIAKHNFAKLVWALEQQKSVGLVQETTYIDERRVCYMVLYAPLDDATREILQQTLVATFGYVFGKYDNKNVFEWAT